MYKDLSTDALKDIINQVNSYDFKEKSFIYDENLKINDEFISLFEKYVPDYGEAKTILGEIVNNYLRLEYRYFNDGDMLGAGYGRETCNPSAICLCELTTEQIADFIKNDLAFQGESREKLRNELNYYTQEDPEYQEIKELLNDDFPSDRKADEVENQTKYESNLFKLKLMLGSFIKENIQLLEQENKYKMDLDDDIIYDYFSQYSQRNRNLLTTPRPF